MSDERSVIRLGRSKVISLPDKWCRENNVCVGDKLDIYPTAGRLVITPKSAPADIAAPSYEDPKTSKETKIDISALVRRALKEVQPNY